MNAVSVLRARQEEGCVLRNVVGGDESVDGRQSLDKLLRRQLHGQETAKLDQCVLTLKVTHHTLVTPCVQTLKEPHNTLVTPCVKTLKVPHNTLVTCVLTLKVPHNTLVTACVLTLILLLLFVA